MIVELKLWHKVFFHHPESPVLNPAQIFVFLFFIVKIFQFIFKKIRNDSILFLQDQAYISKVFLFLKINILPFVNFKISSPLYLGGGRVIS